MYDLDALIFKWSVSINPTVGSNVIPFGKFFNPGNKICHDLDVNWTDNFKLLGFKIDNKLQHQGQN